MLNSKKKINLCDSCLQCPGGCEAMMADVKYGNGKGKDNIYKCKKYINKEELIKKRREEFLAYLPEMRKVAKDLGYALATHGSMNRDFDVVAIPWAENVAPPNILAMKMYKVANGKRWRAWWDKGQGKPHGRKAYAFDWKDTNDSLLYCDLSIMPIKEPKDYFVTIPLKGKGFKGLELDDNISITKCLGCGYEFVIDPVAQKNLVLKGERLVEHCPKCGQINTDGAAVEILERKRKNINTRNAQRGGLCVDCEYKYPECIEELSKIKGVLIRSAGGRVTTCSLHSKNNIFKKES